MFTGLIEECGHLAALTYTAQGARLKLLAPLVSQGVRIGDSIAVNGCCLTVCTHEGESLEFDLLGETLKRTNLGLLSLGTPVNLERALAVGGRLGGHFVQGHIDGTATVLSLEQIGPDHRLEVTLPPEQAHYVIFKGSIAIDGISLTVAEVREASFVVWLIPHTLAATNLQARRQGDIINLEFDLLAKYVERLVSKQTQPAQE